MTNSQVNERLVSGTAKAARNGIDWALAVGLLCERQAKGRPNWDAVLELVEFGGADVSVGASTKL